MIALLHQPWICSLSLANCHRYPLFSLFSLFFFFIIAFFLFLACDTLSLSFSSCASEKPNISPFRFPHTLTEGMSVITTCSILTGDAPIRVEWYKDSAPLDLASLNIHRNEMGDLGSSLVFRSVGPAHAGNYTCFARNRAGEDSFTAPMIVKGMHISSLSTQIHV